MTVEKRSNKLASLLQPTWTALCVSLLFMLVMAWTQSLARSACLPSSGTGILLPSSGGETVHASIGATWLTKSEVHFWNEFHSVRWGAPGVFTVGQGAPIESALPAYCDPVGLFMNAEPGLTAVVWASGWPWRNWVSTNVRAAEGSAWQRNEFTLWWRMLADLGVGALVGFAAGNALRALARAVIHRVRANAGRCPQCGYDLKCGVSCVCPECGKGP